MAGKYDCLKLENQICFPLYAASREIIKKYHPFLEELELTYTQYIVMMVFWEEESITVKDLGKKLFLDSGTLTPVLKSLEVKGLVKRERSKEDERVVIARITEDGLKMREKAVEIPVKMQGCANISSEEAAELYRILHKMLGDEM